MIIEPDDAPMQPRGVSPLEELAKQAADVFNALSEFTNRQMQVAEWKRGPSGDLVLLVVTHTDADGEHRHRVDLDPLDGLGYAHYCRAPGAAEFALVLPPPEFRPAIAPPSDSPASFERRKTEGVDGDGV